MKKQGENINIISSLIPQRTFNEISINLIFWGEIINSLDSTHAIYGPAKAIDPYFRGETAKPFQADRIVDATRRRIVRAFNRSLYIGSIYARSRLPPPLCDARAPSPPR